MKILETDQGWAVEHNGTIPMKIEGTGYFPDKAVLVSAIEKRKLYIWSDGSIERRPEPGSQAALDDEAAFEAAAPKDSSGAPPTEDPPVDPDADKDRPKPSPKPTAPGNKKSRAKKPAEEPKRGRGRPRIYTKEEAEERRRQKAKEYAANRSEEQKAAARERARKWREENPDKVKAARDRSMQNRAKRYKEDPKFREQFNEYQREYKRAKRSGDK